MSNKKLYWQLSTLDGPQMIGTMDNALGWISSEIDEIKESNVDEYEYTLTPVWLTEDEYDNLPES